MPQRYEILVIISFIQPAQKKRQKQEKQNQLHGVYAPLFISAKNQKTVAIHHHFKEKYAS
jgi:hypothetical protein